jgi:predicted chitinase
MRHGTIDRAAFFAEIRLDPFGGRLAKRQVEGLSAILDRWQARVGDGDRRQLAYVLATAFHETAATMQPVRETQAKTDAEAIRRLESAFAAGRLARVKTPYWRPDPDGRSWLGRGLVQLTHRRNYDAMSAVVGCDLVAEPALAMRMDVSVAILIEGMRRGSFTGRRLDEFFADAVEDWQGARRIINGTDRAGLVADHAKAFARALRS